MNKTTALIASLLMIATSLSGCITEELVDDVLGCMDENAENYDENATLEALGDCFYMASVDQFMEQISEMSIDEMLDVNPRAGYSSVIEMTMVEDEMGMGEMNIHIEEHVMVDLANDSAMVRTYLSVYPMMTVDYTVIQVGQVVNIHSLASGMMADAVSSSTQTRDADGSVLDMVHAMIDGSPAEGIPGLGMGDDQPDSDDDDDMPTESASFTYDASTGTQTMTMSMTEDGASTEMTIHLDENEELVSYEMNMDDGTNTTVMSYTVMWGDAVVIEVDETLPKTALPVWFDGLSETLDDGHGDDDGDDGDGPPSPEEVLYTFDSDGDGYLSWDEFWYSWGDGESQDAQDDMMGIFQEADTDSDDLLSLEELDYFIEMVDDYDSHDGDEMSPDMILDMMDYNDDGSVSWTEFDDFIIYEDGGWADEQERSESQDAFDYSDANGDGSLDYEELEHWISTMGDDDDSEEMFLCDDGHEEIPMDWVNDGYEDCEDGSDEYDDGDDDYTYYCSNDGEDYAESMGGILCPEGPGVTPECPNGESCVCIDVDGSCDDGDDDWGYYADDDDGSDSDEPDDDGHDDDGPPSPEDAMYMTDSDGDGNMSQEEFVTYWNNENPDAPIDSDQSFLTTEDVEDLIELCDYDVPSDLIDINEMQCFIDNLVGMMPDDENTPSLDDFFNHFDTDGDGHLTATEFIDANDVPDEDQDGVHDMFDMYDNDESGGLDYYEFEPLYDMMVDNDDGDDGDDDGDGMERNDATGFVAENQTLNAPITDFEVHFLSDCEEEYDEEEDQMIQPDLSACTNEFSIPLTGGEAEGVTITYTDHDGDGLVSPGDEMSVEWGDYDGEEIDKMEIYDTYASQYSSESAAMPPVLPGFGAILGALALLGAAVASRRD